MFFLRLVKFPREALARLKHAAVASGVAEERIIASPFVAEGADFLDMSSAAGSLLS